MALLIKSTLPSLERPLESRKPCRLAWHFIEGHIEGNVMTYLDNVRGNLKFLYLHSQVVSSLRAFGAHDEYIAEFLTFNNSSDCDLPVLEFTLDVVCELGIFELADRLQRAIERRDESAISRVLSDKNFSVKVPIILYALSQIASAEREEAKTAATSIQASANASKFRKKDANGKLVIDSAKEMLDEWNKNPTYHKNATAFKNDLINALGCSQGTATTWLEKFVSDGLVHKEVLEILPQKLASKAPVAIIQ